MNSKNCLEYAIRTPNFSGRARRRTKVYVEGSFAYSKRQNNREISEKIFPYHKLIIYYFCLLRSGLFLHSLLFCFCFYFLYQMCRNFLIVVNFKSETSSSVCDCTKVSCIFCHFTRWNECFNFCFTAI